jgi:putative phosphoribosyl transferase
LKFELPNFHFKFKDRRWAGKVLAPAINDILKKTGKENQIDGLTIFSIPRGGIIVADSIADKLSHKYNFEIVIPRKLTSPHNKELAIGAIMEDGTTYLNEELITTLEISDSYLEREKKYQLNEIKRRKKAYLEKDTDFEEDILVNAKIENEVVVLIDDGAATGSTLIVAARWIRKKHPLLLIISVPVAPKETVDLLRNEADFVEVFSLPDTTKFKSVGQYYQSFNPVTDEEVISILQHRKSRKFH